MQIQIQDLSMTYPSGKQALQRLDLDLTSPSLVGLLGPNGAGKSTLMKLLVAALLPTQGSILVDGRPLDRSQRALKARLGYLPQSFGLYDELTVYQFLDYMAALKGLRNSRSAIDQVIRAVNLEEKRRARIRTLSGGQRQALTLLMATLQSHRLCWETRSSSSLTSPPWAWTRRSASTSATSFPRQPRTGWCCCPPISLRMCSRSAASWSLWTRAGSCSPALRKP